MTSLVETEVSVSIERGSEVVLYTTSLEVTTGVYTPVTVLDMKIMRKLLAEASLLSVLRDPSFWVQADC